MFKIDIDIRRLLAFLTDKSLEQYVNTIGVHTGHTQAVAHG